MNEHDTQFIKMAYGWDEWDIPERIENAKKLSLLDKTRNIDETSLDPDFQLGTVYYCADYVIFGEHYSTEPVSDFEMLYRHMRSLKTASFIIKAIGFDWALTIVQKDES